MYLVLLQLGSGDGLEIGYCEYHMAGAGYGADVVSELASMGTITWGSELDFADDPDGVGDGDSGNPEGYLQVGFIDDC